ncbi:porin, partial [Enterovirga sp.]|uniref:porin n=1 Tax=Enterovirga sp. TaxID=2026350 RepID=UPI002BDC2B59
MKQLGLLVLAGTAMAAPALAAERLRPYEGGAMAACPQHGAGFVQVPGTSTCIRIGGRARADYSVTSGRRKIDRGQISGFSPSGSLAAEARTETEAGPLRAYVRTRAGGGPYGGR